MLYKTFGYLYQGFSLPSLAYSFEEPKEHVASFFTLSSTSESRLSLEFGCPCHSYFLMIEE